MVLPEIIAVGIFNSNVAAKNIAVSKGREISRFEIELPIENSGISYINSTTKKIRTNMIICAKPGQFRRTKFPYQCYYVHMTMKKNEPLYDILINAPNFFKVENVGIYERIFKRLIKHYNSFSENEEIIVQSLILELIYTIDKTSRGVKDSDSVNHNIIISKALQYIKEHLTDDLSLNKVADAMSLSPVYFHNTFKKVIGRTLHDYVEEQRIKKAIQLLMSTDYTLSIIALECGFSSQSYFNYIFKRKMKTTPREYVKEIYNKYEA